MDNPSQTSAMPKTIFPRLPGGTPSTAAAVTRISGARGSDPPDKPRSRRATTRPQIR